MKIVYEPSEFADIIYCIEPYNGVCNRVMSTSPNTFFMTTEEFNRDKVLFNCPTKIIYYRESYDDIKFKLPVSIKTRASIRRVLKYHSILNTFYMRNVKSKKWSKFDFPYGDGSYATKEQDAMYYRGIKRAQRYPDDKLGVEYESDEDKLYYTLCETQYICSFDIFLFSRPSVMHTGRYEIYYTRFGLETEHRFIDIIVDDTLIKQK